MMQDPFLGKSQDQSYQSPTNSAAAKQGSKPRNNDQTAIVEVDHHDEHWDQAHGIVNKLSTKAQRRSAVYNIFKPLHLHPRMEDCQQWRHRLGKALESERAHWFILALILIDVLATSIDIVLTLHTKANDVRECRLLLEQCTKPEPWRPHSTEHAPLFFTSTGILGLLCINLLLLFVAFGFNFFRHPGYVLDLAIIPSALFLEIFLDSEVLALLVILNLWRLVRVAHGVFTVTDDAVEEEVERLKHTIAVLERESHDLKVEVERCKARTEINPIE